MFVHGKTSETEGGGSATVYVMGRDDLMVIARRRSLVGTGEDDRHIKCLHKRGSGGKSPGL